MIVLIEEVFRSNPCQTRTETSFFSPLGGAPMAIWTAINEWQVAGDERSND